MLSLGFWRLHVPGNDSKATASRVTKKRQSSAVILHIDIADAK
jgi:hypothetical protein